MSCAFRFHIRIERNDGGNFNRQPKPVRLALRKDRRARDIKLFNRYRPVKEL